MTPYEEALENPSLYVHHTFTIPQGQAGLRIDKWLCQKIPHVSRTRIQAGIKAENILVNSLKTKANYLIRPHDVITIGLPHPPRTEGIEPENIPLHIVYEDDHIIVVNKEAPMVVHPARDNWTGTLVHALLYHFQHYPTSHNTQKNAKPLLGHRIDKGTSGLLVI